MERLTNNNRQGICFSQERFHTGNPERDKQMSMWWTTFNRLALTPSEGGSDMRPIMQVVRDIYFQEHFQRSNVVIEEVRENGPLVVTIPEFNPHNANFTPRIIAGHLDTVKGTERNPEIRDDIVYSNGPSIDNKGPVAAIITATDTIVANGIPHPALRLVFTTDEETDSRQIELVPVGVEERAFILDKSGPLGTIVLGSGGYTGISAHIENLSDERMREFLVRFDKRLGEHIIARRRIQVGDLPDILQGRQFSIHGLEIGPNNSRNTVASEGGMQIAIADVHPEEANQVLAALQEWISPLGGAVNISKRDGNSQEFAIVFHGKAGHTSKVGIVEDDGMTTVLTDATDILAPFADTISDVPIASNQEVRINVGNVSVRRDQGMNMELSGEARYRSGDDATIILQDLQSLVQEFGGTMESIEENRAYQLEQNTASVREAAAVLETNGYPVHFLHETFAIADANNAPRQWNAVVLSDGSINPHRSDEAISLESVDGLLRVFYDLATGAESIVLPEELR